MRIATFGVVLLAAANATSQAWATDIARPLYKAPPVPVSANTGWAGFYIGAHGGYAWGDPSLDFDPSQVPLPDGGHISGFAPASPFTLSATPKGAFGGLQVGYNWQLFKAAALSTLLGVGSELGSTTGTGGNSDVIIALRRGSSDSLNQIGQKVVQRNLNIQPTLTIRPGFPVRVIVNRDLVLEPYKG